MLRCEPAVFGPVASDPTVSRLINPLAASGEKALQAVRSARYSVGMVITEIIHQHVPKIPAPAWTPAVEADGKVRDGAWVAELTGSLLAGWPEGMRPIVRKERPRPGPG